MSNFGFVYLLANDRMPDIYKIGCTERSPHARAAELSASTGVPASFEVLCYIEVQDFQAVEKRLHKYFAECRVSSNREFFECDLDEAVGWMWWFPDRISFGTRHKPYQQTLFGIEGRLTALGFDNFYQLHNPWRKEDPKPQAPETSAEVIADQAIKTAKEFE